MRQLDRALVVAVVARVTDRSWCTHVGGRNRCSLRVVGNFARMAKRRFRDSTRVALFLAARGHCASCGVPLEPGWHADHVDPESGGGATEPPNGRALCPRCNLVKGAKPA